jgi:hypothetical protein
MKKFIVLYHSSSTARDQMSKATPEQAKAGMDAWKSWAGKAASAIVDFGAPLGAAGNVPAGNPSSVAGYSILQAESGKKITALLDGHPHLAMPGNTIEVLETLQLPGM